MKAPFQPLRVPGARLRYRDEGRGRAVVLVHGWPLDLEVWEPQGELAAALRVVRFDRRGFGLSSGRPSLADDVDDLHRLLITLQVVSPLLVGMSQGARVVLEFAARHPGLARGLVLDGPPPLGTSGERGAEVSDLPLERLRRLAAEEGLEAFRREWRVHPLMRLVTDDARRHQLLARILQRYPGHDLLAAPAPHDSLDAARLALVRTPALVVNGALDTDARRRAGQALQRALPFAEHTLIAHAAHLPNLDAAATYNQLLIDFARRHIPAAA